MGHDLTDIFSSTQGMGHFVSPSKKMAKAYFWRKLPYISCFQPYQMVDENRSVGNAKICISDNLQMIHAGIPPWQRDSLEIYNLTCPTFSLANL
jgi:hypothetical protein